MKIGQGHAKELKYTTEFSFWYILTCLDCTKRNEKTIHFSCTLKHREYFS